MQTDQGNINALLSPKDEKAVPPQNRNQFPKSMYWTTYSKHKPQPKKPTFQEEFPLC